MVPDAMRDIEATVGERTLIGLLEAPPRDEARDVGEMLVNIALRDKRIARSVDRIREEFCVADVMRSGSRSPLNSLNQLHKIKRLEVEKAQQLDCEVSRTRSSRKDVDSINLEGRSTS